MRRGNGKDEEEEWDENDWKQKLEHISKRRREEKKRKEQKRKRR